MLQIVHILGVTMFAYAAMQRKGVFHMPCNIGSINQIHKRLNENGYAISKRLLRQLVESGQLPYVKSGSKY